MSMDAGGLRKSEETQSSSAEVPLDKGDLGRQRLPAKAVRQWCRRSSADFGSPRTIFHQIIGYCSHALKNLDPGVGARFRRMNHLFSTLWRVSVRTSSMRRNGRDAQTPGTPTGLMKFRDSPQNPAVAEYCHVRHAHSRLKIGLMLRHSKWCVALRLPFFSASLLSGHSSSATRTMGASKKSWVKDLG